jgi:hypothetical protein
MAYTPAGTVYLCDVPLDVNQKNQFLFADKTAQAAYFASKIKKSYSNFTYQRKDNMLKVDAHIDELWNCNYAVYTNDQSPNKTFYAFITRMEWLSNSATALFLETDVFQTFFLDCTFLQSFVEREHIVTDTIGANIEEENLELGEIVPNTVQSAVGLGTMDIIAACVESTEGVTGTGNLWNGIYSGVFYYGCSSAANMGAFISSNYGGKPNSVMAIFMLPHAICQCGTNVTLLAPIDLQNNITYTAPARPSTVNGYTPKNKKLLTYPYLFLYGHNNSGAAAVYNYDLFDGNPAFKVVGALSPNATFKIYPTNMKHNSTASNDREAGLTLGGFPICAWASDVYTAWVAQQAGALGLGLAAGALSLTAGLLTTNPYLVAGGASAIFGSLMSQAQRRAQPDQAHGSLSSGSANCSESMNDFLFQVKSIRSAKAQILDKYFDMFGYKTNMVKTPNLNSRPYWNYVKTIDCNISGDVPSFDMIKLKKIFDEGVTLWHNSTYIGNYGLNNHN